MKYEICVDNVQSVEIAAEAAVDRLELCAALSLGGLTPSYAFIKEALTFSTLQHYVMIRPRAGDFLFDAAEVNIMINDILMAKELGAQGVVIGALKPNREIDLATCEKLVDAASGMGVTFHRAFDLCRNSDVALEQIIDLGCERLLTSGLEKNAWLGRVKIAQLVKQSAGRISIMPGAGVTATNAADIVETTAVNELHFSAKGDRKNKMQSFDVSMGRNSAADNQVTQTDLNEVLAIKQNIAALTK